MNGGRKYTNNTVPCAAAADDLTTHVQAAATCIYPILSYHWATDGRTQQIFNLSVLLLHAVGSVSGMRTSRSSWPAPFPGLYSRWSPSLVF